MRTTNVKRFYYSLGVFATLLLTLYFRTGAIAQLAGNPADANQVSLKQAKVVQVSPIDTTKLDQQFLRSERPFVIRPENPRRKMSAGKANNLPVGQIRGDSTINLLKNFPGNEEDGSFPPDCTLAVGPTHLVSTVNSNIAFYERNGFKTFSVPSTAFFGGLDAGDFQFDPKVIYSRTQNRFVIIFLEQDDGSKTSKLLIAASASSNPNGTWFRYRLEAKITFNINNTNYDYWMDYPGLGINRDAVIVSGNMFGFPDVPGQFGFLGTQFIIIPLNGLFSGQPFNYFTGLTGDFTVQMCETMSNTERVLYGVTIDSDDSSIMRLIAFDRLNGFPTISTRNLTIPAFQPPTRDAISTNGRSLDGLGGRLLNAVRRGGTILTTHTVQSNPNSTLRCRWYEINTNGWPGNPGGVPSLNQTGDVSSPNADHFMPAIHKNGLGDISMIFTRSSANIAADIMVASRRSTDPLGTMGAPLRLQRSSGNRYPFFRWGDYFGINTDPTNDSTFWGTAMYINQSNTWSTSIFNWSVSGAILPAPQNLVAVAAPNLITLSWGGIYTAPLYSVKRSLTPGGPYTLIAKTRNTFYADTALQNGVTYYYVVSWETDSLESPDSNEASATPNIPGFTELLENPGFENGEVIDTWFASVPNVANNAPNPPAFAGDWKAILGGKGVSGVETLQQEVTIPAVADRVVFSYNLRIDTGEASTRQLDRLRIQIRDLSGRVLRNVGAYSNANATQSYRKYTFDVSSLRGRTVRIFLESVEDSARPTSFLLDDFSLAYTTPL